MLMWNCKSRERKKIYQTRLNIHWDEHEDGRHDNQNYCASSGGRAASVAIDDADQAKLGVFKTSHRGIQDAYLKVKQKITGALVHGIGYYLFRSFFHIIFIDTIWLTCMLYITTDYCVGFVSVCITMPT